MGFPNDTYTNPTYALTAMMNKAGAQGLSGAVADGPDATVHAILANLLTGLPGGTVSKGSGITGAGTVYKSTVVREGDLIVTKILIDLTDLTSGGTAGDIIGGASGTANSHIGQITAAVTGTVQAIKMECLETPAGGDTDLDLYSATEGTGAEDVAISTLTETQLINAGTQASGTVTAAAAVPAADQYLYLVGQGTANAAYTAGKFLITIYGTPA
jgi:hypothetical protein